MSNGKTYSFEEAIDELFGDDPAVWREIAFNRWYRGMLDRAVAARQTSGRTQADVAAALGTTQSSIARLENDTSGGVSARRLFAYLAECGVEAVEPKIATAPPRKDPRPAAASPTSGTPAPLRRAGE